MVGDSSSILGGVTSVLYKDFSCRDGVIMKKFENETIHQYQHLIGHQVYKRSNKPFKSGNKVNTVKSITVHTETARLGFTFEEDDSVVECWRCLKVDNSEYFKILTVPEALQYCYAHEKQYVSETDRRTFDCLITIVETGTIKPAQLPEYGMDYGRL